MEKKNLQKRIIKYQKRAFIAAHPAVKLCWMVICLCILAFMTFMTSGKIEKINWKNIAFYFVCFFFSLLYLLFSNQKKKKYLWIKDCFKSETFLQVRTILIKAKYMEGNVPVVRTEKRDLYKIEDKKKLKKLPPQCVVIFAPDDYVVVPEKMFRK